MRKRHEKSDPHLHRQNSRKALARTINHQALMPLSYSMLERRLVLAGTPFFGTPQQVEDGFRLEVETFDLGGEGMGYHDSDAANNGAEFRPNEGVDIRTAADEDGGHAVSWFTSNEWMDYTVDVAAGTYAIDARIATGVSNVKDIRLSIGDGTDFTELGTFATESTGSWSNYQSFTISDVELDDATEQVIRVELLEGGSSFNLNWIEFNIQTPTITAVQSGSWDDANTWNGQVPDESLRAIVPQGISVELDGTDHSAKELVVQGVMNVAENVGTAMTLTADWIHVNSGGIFQIGTQQDRYDANQFVITLTGTDPKADHLIETANGMMEVMNNDGFLMAAMGGRLQFFGADKLSFTKLGTTAEAGDSEIIVENIIERNFDGDTSAASDGELNWQTGDQIVIASSSYDYAAEDVRTIATIVDIGGGQSRITLDNPLSHRHFGEVESYGHNIDATSAAPERTWDVDLRAEVSLLSRNVKITGLQSQDTDGTFGDRANLIVGDDGKSVNGIGANTMIMGTAGQISVEGVQFDLSGQAGRVGRYPFHWHFGGDRSGDVLRNASITNSNNRAVVVHGTDNVVVEGVVAHDIHGHGFFLESGVEQHNQFLSNIAHGIHKTGGYDNRFEPFVVDGSDTHVDGGDRFSTTSAFWVKNPNNVFVGNIVAGSKGSGWWIDQHNIIDSIPGQAFFDAVPGLEQMYQRDPLTDQLGTFSNNTVHSTTTGFVNKTKSYGLINPGEFGENHITFGDVDPVFEDFTVYKVHAGIYSLYSNILATFSNFRSVDNKIAIWDSDPTMVDDGLIVGRSRGNAEANNENYVEAVQLYHGRAILSDVHFAGFGESGAYFFGTGTGNRHRPEFEVDGLTFEDDDSYDRIRIRRGGDISPYNLKTIFDRDGSLTGPLGGGAGHLLIPNDSFGVDAAAGDDIPASRWEFAITDRRYANFQLFPESQSVDKVNARITVTAPHGVSFTLGGTDAENNNINNSHRERSRFQASLNYQDYTIDFPRGYDSDTELLRFNYLNWSDDLVNASTVFRVIGIADQMTPTWYATGHELNRAADLNSLRNETETSYFKDAAGDLWLKLFVTQEDGIHSNFIDMALPSSINHRPIAVNDTVDVAEDICVMVSVLNNDNDPENDILTVTAVTQGANGSVTHDGTIVTYTPNENYSGPDSFSYEISDGNGGFDTAIVEVMVTNRLEIAGPIVVGNGTDSRSVVEQLVVSFDDTVTIQPDAFVVSLQSNTEQIPLKVTVDNSSGQSIVTLAFDSPLADGNYELAIDGNKISSSVTGQLLDGDNDGTPGGNFLFGGIESDNFFAFFGDTDGNRVVNIFDLLRFRQSFGKSIGDADFDEQVDSNGDGVVNVFDLLKFRQNYGSSI